MVRANDYLSILFKFVSKEACNSIKSGEIVGSRHWVVLTMRHIPRINFTHSISACQRLNCEMPKPQLSNHKDEYEYFQTEKKNLSDKFNKYWT